MKKAPISSGKKRVAGWGECEPVLSHCSYKIKLRHTRNEGKGRNQLAKDQKLSFGQELVITWPGCDLLGFWLSEGTTC